MLKWDIKAVHDPKKDIIRTILENRGIQSEEEQNTFLDPPSIEHWFKSLPRELLLSLKNARDLINETIKNDKAILIHGDYDVDGVCATAILYKTIKEELGYSKVYAFIPNRFDHGYGLSEKSIEASLSSIPQSDQKKGALLITVDTGITAIDETLKLKKLGHKVIITDHHQKGENLPQADCIVWYDRVVGATVSWLLAKVVGAKNREYLSLISLATVTDLQPLLNFNRTIVKEGLKEMNENMPLGLKQLIIAAGRNNAEVTSYDLGWVLGPRLNASGRVLDAVHSLNLLLEKEEEKAKELAWSLNQVNSQRQDKTLEMYELAAEVDSENLPKIIISHDENYHEGIIGLVASRLVQEFYRPAIVVSTSEKVAKGSVRSVPGVNIIELLREKEEIFLSLGGHPMAAGFSIEMDRLNELKEFLVKDAEKMIDDSLLIKGLEIDLKLGAEDLNLELFNKLEGLKPFGLGNSAPLFATSGFGVLSSGTVGKEGKHLLLKLMSKDKILKGIMFNASEEFLDIKAGETIDLAYSLNKNEFNGNTTLELLIKDIKRY